MSFSIKIMPGVKVRRRCGRTGIGVGPHWLRHWSWSDGGRGVSGGAGPFGFYRPARRQRGRHR